MPEVNGILDVFCKYTGGNILYILSIIGLIMYLLSCKKSERDKIVVCLITLFIVAFNPLSYHVLKKVTDEAVTYYRLLWVLPVTILFAYFVYILVSKVKNKQYQLLITVFLSVAFIIWGTRGNGLSLPDNKWQIPDSTLEVAYSLEALMDSKDIDRAVVLPDYEIANTLRQYTGRVLLPCSPRNLDINSREETIEGVMAMLIDNRDDIATDTVDNILKTYGVRYIVVSISNGNSIGLLENLGWKRVDGTTEYLILESFF